MNEHCFAKGKGVSCKALTGNCPGHKACPFYKPMWKYKQEMAEIDRRLNEMPMDKQLLFAEKYYHGEMPWVHEEA